MGRGLRRLSAMICGAALLMTLAGCADTLTEFDAASYVRGVLNETYKGTWDAVFLSQVDLTEAQAQDAYDDAIDQEYLRFCYQFDLRDQYLDRSTREEVKELLQDVAARASFAVGKAVALDDTRYAVEVNVRPMDLFLQVRDDALADLTEEFQERYSDVDLAAMDQAAQERFWERYERAWARNVTDLCRTKMATLDYRDVETILILVEPDSQGMYGMSDNDFTNLANLILPY